MSSITCLFLETNLSQIQTNNIILEKLRPALDYLTYNVKRYKIPVTLVMFYSKEDISEALKKSIRLTDVPINIKIGNSYFSFIFLPFTESLKAYTFIKHVEKNYLVGIENIYYFEELQPNEFNYYNFLNSYLFKISEKIETDSLTK